MPGQKNVITLVTTSLTVSAFVFVAGLLGYFDRSSAVAADEPPAKTNTGPVLVPNPTFSLVPNPPSSTLAKQALDELWEIRQKGGGCPTDSPGVSVWSERYMNALEKEKVPQDELVAALAAHMDFMTAYANFVIQSPTASKPAITDASYAFGLAVDTFREVKKRK